MIAHTGLVGGGESDSVTFQAPSPGTYNHICSFPGHYATMNGDFIVS
ncbi:MAG TPA: plastocyanin/azurin family copper-binding protein [Sandaracinaceae bacterium LLY-WYZ-13_1]|nr:plastocyanin/azurin family copper-binding protein [Sandaracinaceae bacterium LLY-WYZ-13_1]